MKAIIMESREIKELKLAIFFIGCCSLLKDSGISKKEKKEIFRLAKNAFKKIDKFLTEDLKRDLEREKRKK